jgi:hypothetical protein
VKFIPLVSLVLLAGCGAPAACDKPEVVTQIETKTVTVDHYVMVHPTDTQLPHQDLIDLWNKTRAAESPFVAKAKAPVINQLLKLDAAGNKAFAPIEDPNHMASLTEVQNAVQSLAVIQQFLREKH